MVNTGVSVISYKPLTWSDGRHGGGGSGRRRGGPRRRGSRARRRGWGGSRRGRGSRGRRPWRASPGSRRIHRRRRHGVVGERRSGGGRRGCRCRRRRRPRGSSLGRGGRRGGRWRRGGRGWPACRCRGRRRRRRGGSRPCKLEELRAANGRQKKREYVERRRRTEIYKRKPCVHGVRIGPSIKWAPNGTYTGGRLYLWASNFIIPQTKILNYTS